MKRLVIFGLVAALLWTTETIWLTVRQPEVSTQLAVLQINNGSAVAKRLREFEAFKDGVTEATSIVTVLAALLCFDSLLRRSLGIMLRSSIRFGRRAHLLALLAPTSLVFLATGCVRPFDTPQYVEIDTSETGF